MSLLTSPTTYWSKMLRATSPPTAQPMVGFKWSGQMTHTAYTNPLQTIVAISVPNALNTSRIVASYSCPNSPAKKRCQP